MKYLADGTLFALMVIAWIFGFVLAKGTTSTIACLFPPYAWYLVAENLATVWGMK